MVSRVTSLKQDTSGDTDVTPVSNSRDRLSPRDESVDEAEQLGFGPRNGCSNAFDLISEICRGRNERGL